MDTSDDSMGMVETPIANVDAILLRPHEQDGPAIFFWLSDGGTLLRVFADDSECDKEWSVFTEDLPSDSFVRYHDVFFRPEALVRVEGQAIDGKEYVRFELRNNKVFSHHYPDSATQKRDLALVTGILSALQDVRAGEPSSITKQ